MRSEADIFYVRVVMQRDLQLDLERLEQNPVWRQLIDRSPGVPLTEVVKAYLAHFLVRDEFPHQTPGTNGPGEISNVILEVSWPQQSA